MKFLDVLNLGFVVISSCALSIGRRVLAKEGWGHKGVGMAPRSGTLSGAKPSLQIAYILRVIQSALGPGSSSNGAVNLKAASYS